MSPPFSLFLWGLYGQWGFQCGAGRAFRVRAAREPGWREPVSRVVTAIAHGMQFPKALPHPSATCCGVVPVWETSFALCSEGGISVLVRSHLQSKGCWWEMLGAGQPSSTCRACGRN